jgi:hypothetical protein
LFKGGRICSAVFHFYSRGEGLIAALIKRRYKLMMSESSMISIMELE